MCMFKLNSFNQTFIQTGEHGARLPEGGAVRAQPVHERRPVHRPVEPLRLQVLQVCVLNINILLLFSCLFIIQLFVYNSSIC